MATRWATARVWFSGMMIWRVIAHAASRPKAVASTVARVSMFLAWAASVSRTTVCEVVSWLLTSSRMLPWAAMRTSALALADCESRNWLTAAR
ncbi:hypothetical protein D3C81_1969100 [compost metagenome]